MKKWHIFHKFKPTKIYRKIIDGDIWDNEKIYYAALLECRFPRCKKWKVVSKVKYTGRGSFLGAKENKGKVLKI